MKTQYDLAIVGAGAAGLMAAAAALTVRGGLRVVLLEKNAQAARKLYATGNGRCNFLNRGAQPSSYHCGEAGADAEGFVCEVFRENGVPQILAMLQKSGLVFAEEEQGRLYPRSMQASDVVRTLLFGASHAQLFTGFDVSACRRTSEGFFITAADGRQVTAGSLLLAGGGKAGIRFGSDGRCYQFAQSFGHSLVKPIPALTGFVLSAQTPELDGVRTHAAASIFGEAEIPGQRAVQRTLLGRDTGEVQFSAGGISGICCMNISRWLRMADGVSFELSLDLFPEYETEALTALFEERLALFGDRSRLLEGLLSDKLITYVQVRTQNAPPAELAAYCKDLRFPLQGTRGWPDSQTTAGGVRLSEIDPKTMESRLTKDLYLAGELVDIDGPCGGYNLTWAFASALAAGRAAALASGDKTE